MAVVKIRRLYISQAHNFFGHHGRAAGTEPMLRMHEVECVAGKGLRGDRFFAYKRHYKGQITFFSWEVFEDLCLAFDEREKSPSVFRRNAIVTGADLNTLIGKPFEVQGVRFLGTEEASPCYWMNEAFHEGAHGALKGRGGLRAEILSDGVLREDDPGDDGQL